MTTMLILQTTEKMDVVHQDRLFHSPVRAEIVLLVTIFPPWQNMGDMLNNLL